MGARSDPAQAAYREWISRAEASTEELAAMQEQAGAFDYLPLFSVVLVVSDADEVWIKSSLDSVLGGIYPHVEVRVCDVASERPHVAGVLADYAAADGRVKVERLEDRSAPPAAYNAALAGAAGEFVALMEAGDELAPDALFRVAEFVQDVRADVVYTDEDLIDVSGDRLRPTFKPYWSRELALSAAYTGRLCVFRKALLDDVGGFREDFGGAEEHDLILRLSEKSRRIHHLPGVLYHRRSLPGRAEPGGGAGDGLRRSVEEALARAGEEASVEPVPSRASVRVRRRLAGHPEVSVIVSAPEGTPRLPILAELERKTSYPVRQVIVASGDDRRSYPGADRVVHPFPARALNLAAERAEGAFLVFVDGGARVGTPGWIPELLSYAHRQRVGLVGCKLQNPDGGLRHGGSLPDLERLVGRPGEAVSGGAGNPPLVDGPFDFAAASARCMAIRKAAFDRMEGFDDENLPTSFYDLDLSLRLREMGRTNVYTPYASLVLEGGPKPPPGEEELAYVWGRWWGELVRLLYYRWSPLYIEHRDTYAQTPGLLSS